MKTEILLLISNVLTAVVSFLIGKRKTNAETDSIILKNLENSILIYSSLIQNLKSEIESLNMKIQELEKKIDDLMEENNQLKKKNYL